MLSMQQLLRLYSTDSRAIFHQHLALPSLPECRPVFWLTYWSADTRSSVSRHIDRHINQYSNRDQHIGQYCRPILNRGMYKLHKIPFMFAVRQRQIAQREEKTLTLFRGKSHCKRTQIINGFDHFNPFNKTRHINELLLPRLIINLGKSNLAFNFNTKKGDLNFIYA